MELRRVLFRSRGADDVAALAGAFAPATFLPTMPTEEDAADPSSRLLVSLDALDAPDFDPFALDVALHAALDRSAGSIDLLLDAGRLRSTAVVAHATALALRWQRLLARRNGASRSALFDEILRRHRAIHDLGKPLVRADFDHARDVWQWTLRLEPRATFELQVAALFHDVERLESEADARIEDLAPDYQAFKDAHAKGSARILRAVLEPLLEGATIDRIVTLVEGHERRSDDPDARLLGEADALSFFSVNACGYARYFGEAQTRRKIAWTYARLGPRGRGLLGAIRLRRDLAAWLDLERRTNDASGPR
jgi:hypothetical protein